MPGKKAGDFSTDFKLWKQENDFSIQGMFLNTNPSSSRSIAYSNLYENDIHNITRLSFEQYWEPSRPVASLFSISCKNITCVKALKRLLRRKNLPFLESTREPSSKIYIRWSNGVLDKPEAAPPLEEAVGPVQPEANPSPHDYLRALEQFDRNVAKIKGSLASCFNLGGLPDKTPQPAPEIEAMMGAPKPLIHSSLSAQLQQPENPQKPSASARRRQRARTLKLFRL